MSQSIKPRTVAQPSSQAAFSRNVDIPVLLLSGGFLIFFVAYALFDIAQLSDLVNTAMSLTTRFFGVYWQILLLLTFIISLAIAVSRLGLVRLGGLDKPEMSIGQWLAIVMCTLLAGGGVFWAGAEPIAHFVSAPPIYAETNNIMLRAYNALAQSFMHWGFLAWAITGSLTSLIFMHLHYDLGLPLKPRSLLYPVFGERALTSFIGTLVDASCVVAVVAGTVGPIGFLGLQVSYGLNYIFGIPDSYTTQITVLTILTFLYTLSAVLGINRGIAILSNFNVMLTVLLVIFVLLFGPTQFIFDAFLNSFGIYVNQFLPMATYRGSHDWLGGWTVFFWGWFLGYGPLMAIFVAKISRGRTARQMIAMIAILAPIITCFWFTILGGSGVAFEVANPNSISKAYAGGNLPAVLFAITEQLPFSFIITILFLILTTIFVATTGNSMTYSISMVMTGTDHPHPLIRLFWGSIMGIMAGILIIIGAGGISALQSFIVVTAIPVSFILLPSLWTAPKILRQMAFEQKIYGFNNQQ